MDKTQSPFRFAVEKLFMLIEAAAWICFVVMIVTMLLQVFTRYVINHPLPWTEELSRFSYIYAIFLGAILVQRSKHHMTVTLLVEKLPPGARLVQQVFSDLVSLMVLGIVFHGTWIQMDKTYGILASTIPISYTFIYLALAIGSGGMILLIVTSLIQTVQKITGLKP
ncbi:MAG: TRAP transporter small permease [Planctomycetes bacterium]|nr:TRAP transporter small permease [Planctomycetota bacterium]